MNLLDLILRSRAQHGVSKDEAATDLGFTQDRQYSMRKSGLPDLRLYICPFRVNSKWVRGSSG